MSETDDLARSMPIRQPSGELLSFNNMDQIHNWLATEQKNWEWLDSQYISQLDLFGSNLVVHVKSALEYSTVILGGNYVQDTFDLFRKAVVAINSALSLDEYIISTTVLGKFICNLASKDPSLAMGVFLLATRPQRDHIAFYPELGVAAGYLANFKLGISKQGAKVSLDSLHKSEQKMASLLLDFENQINLETKKLASIVASIDLRYSTLSHSIAGRLKSERKKLSDLQLALKDDVTKHRGDIIKKSTDDIERFAEFVKKGIALQGPTEYWTTKRNKHRLSTFVSGLVFLIYCITATGFVYGRVSQSVGGFEGFLEHWKDASLGMFGVFGGIAAIALMFARVLYRMFASQLHLWNDASERITMIQTYLALAEKGHAKDEFLGALMNRLFSPATDGVVRDDLGAIGPLDLVGRAFNNKP